MSMSKIAGRYAKSLVDLATEKSALNEVHEDVRTIQSVCENRDFALMLKSPIIHGDKKMEIFKIILGGKISELTNAFVSLLISKGREPLLAQICTEFIQQFKNINKIRTAVVTSAQALGETQLTEIRNRFNPWLKPGETLEIIQKIDASLIGGIIFELDGQQVDSTAKRQLDQMRTNLYDKSYINLVVKS